MCGRLNITDNPAIRVIMDMIDMPLYSERPSRYNISPGPTLDVIYQNAVVPMEWGIEFGKFKHPNTRTDTLKKKPYLQSLLLKHRCVIPANRYYEWPDKKYRPEFKNYKTRFCVHTPEHAMFFAGIAKINSDGVQQFNILTTEANKDLDSFHHRMPVILPPHSIPKWLREPSINEMVALMVPYTEPLNIYECSEYVDNGHHEGPKCIEPRHDVQRVLL